MKSTESYIKKLVKEVILEDDKIRNFPPSPDAKYGNSVGPGTVFQKGNVTPMITMDGSLFKNGIDKIDTNSQAFKSGISAIQKEISSKGQNISIGVVGGASAVGSKEGYDNASLANRRAQNFIALAKKQFPSVKFSVSTKVGNATVKNSPEAEREQFVKLSILGGVKSDKIGQAVDNTQQVMRYKKPMPAEEKTINKETYYKVCYWVPKEKYSEVMSLIKNVGGIDV